MDPNLMQEFMKNPEMMKSAMDMLKNNPGMMKNIMKMGNPSDGANPSSSANPGSGVNPDMMGNIMNMLNPEGNSSSDLEPSTRDNLEETDYSYDDSVFIQGLKTDTYNDKSGLVNGYNQEKSRYEIYLEELDKSISIKEENIKVNNLESEVNEELDELNVNLNEINLE